MPDFTTEYYYHCETLEYWSTTVQGSKNNQYTVTWDNHSHRNQRDYSCTCKAYQYGKGTHCKHIEKVKASGAHCRWSAFLEGGDAAQDKDGDPCCPECGKSVHSMGWAV